LNKIFEYASVDSPKTSSSWGLSTLPERLSLLGNAVEKLVGFESIIDIVDARPDGQVIVKFTEPVGPEIRGTRLLDLEEILKANVDPGITIWLEPLGDKNSLRNLRGIEVKKI
jgi:hypothetical protein